MFRFAIRGVLWLTRKMTNSEGNRSGFAQERLFRSPSLETRYDKHRGSIAKWSSGFRDLRVQRNRVPPDDIAVACGLRRYGVLSVLWKGHRQREVGRQSGVGHLAIQGRISESSWALSPAELPPSATGRESDFTVIGQRRSLRHRPQSMSRSAMRCG
jgi:hypothetical protein